MGMLYEDFFDLASRNARAAWPLPIPTPSQPLAAAVVRCYDLLIERRTVGSRILFEAVNEAFTYCAR